MIQIKVHLFSGLVTYNPDLDIIPDGAHSWEILDNGCTYIFHLRDNVTWSDGTPVTAQDYVCAWRRVLNPDTGSQTASLLYDIKGARAYHQGLGSLEDLGVWVIDQLTLKVALENPASYFLYLLDHSLTFPIPAHVQERIGEAWIKPGGLVTNGPFLIEKWLPGDRMVLKRDPSYHGRFSGNVDRVDVIHSYGDGYSRSQEYDADHLDITTLWYEDILRQKLRHPDEYVEDPNQSIVGILFNSKCSPFDDLRVRQAFAHAIDRQWIVDTYFPTFSPATGGLIPPGIPGHSPGIGLPYDPERAQKLLREAGYPEGKSFPEINVVIHKNVWWPNLTEAFCIQWRDVLKVEIRFDHIIYDNLRRLLSEGQCMGLAGPIPDYLDGDWFLRCFVEDELCKPTGWKDEAYDRLVQTSRLITDQKERLTVYQQADRILMKHAVVLPILNLTSSFLVKPWIKRYLIFGNYSFGSWKDVIIEAHE